MPGIFTESEWLGYLDEEEFFSSSVINALFLVINPCLA